MSIYTVVAANRESCMGTCFDVFVLQKVVQDIDRGLAGEEHLNYEVRGTAIDGDERTGRAGAFDKRHQQL